MSKVSNEVTAFLSDFSLLEIAKNNLERITALQITRLQDIVKNVKSGGSTGDKLTDFVFAMWNDIHTVPKKLKEYKDVQTKMENHIGEYMLVEVWEKHGDDVMYACGTHELKSVYICLIKEGMNFSFEKSGNVILGVYKTESVYIGNPILVDKGSLFSSGSIGISSRSDLKYEFIIGDHEVEKNIRAIRLSKKLLSLTEEQKNLLNFKLYIVMNMMGRNVPGLVCMESVEKSKILWTNKISQFNDVPQESKIFGKEVSFHINTEYVEFLKNISIYAKLGIEVLFPKK